MEYEVKKYPQNITERLTRVEKASANENDALAL
jgi:hypothetical protein